MRWKPDISMQSSDDDNDDVRIWWRSARFRPGEYRRASLSRRLNHFPKSWIITRKDCLSRQIRQARTTYGAVYDFIPETFVLPSEYGKFVRNHLMDSQAETWICKPTDMSCGKKIFITSDPSSLTYDCHSLVQRYVSSPYLIDEHKSDLRVYVLVTSFDCPTIYLYDDFLVRFSTEKFSMDDLENPYRHLTNSSINRHSSSWSLPKGIIGRGAKWSRAMLEEYMREKGDDFDQLWTEIESIVLLTICAVASEIRSSPGCFELLGFDVLVDAALRPWLLEVNTSPALSLDGTRVDELLKRRLVKDMFDVLFDSDQSKIQEEKPKNQFRKIAPRKGAKIKNHEHEQYTSKLARFFGGTYMHDSSANDTTSSSYTPTIRRNQFDPLFLMQVARFEVGGGDEFQRRKCEGE